jgi:hypothetical protein
MADYSPHQKKVIGQYYARRDEIALARLGEIVSELYLAATDRKRDQLWKRAEQAMKALKVPPRLADHILRRRDAEVLARNLRDWLASAKKPGATGSRPKET